MGSDNKIILYDDSILYDDNCNCNLCYTISTIFQLIPDIWITRNPIIKFIITLILIIMIPMFIIYYFLLFLIKN